MCPTYILSIHPGFKKKSTTTHSTQIQHTHKHISAFKQMQTWVCSAYYADWKNKNNNKKMQVLVHEMSNVCV